MSSNDFSRLSVLLADDSMSSHGFLRQLLLDVGIRDIEMARNPEATRAALDRRRFDAVIAHLSVPDDVMEIARGLRHDSAARNHATPLIQVTDSPTKQQVSAALDAGIDSLIAKPISHQRVRTHLGRVVSRRR